MAYFVEPVWRAFDRTQVELFAYSNLLQEDATSQRLKQLVDHWLPVLLLDDAQLAQQVRDDGIDILIDLSGHTVLNRLLAFARKPAPVQASWIGYSETTGLTAMDYASPMRTAAPPGAVDALIRREAGAAAGESAFIPDPNVPRSTNCQRCSAAMSPSAVSTV